LYAFFFQAEDGIRDGHVTGVQTCALPICSGTKRIGNRIGVRIDGTSNTVGGTAAEARNLISGNLAQGVTILGNNNVLEGNYIGKIGRASCRERVEIWVVWL